jgi:histidinol dehydrogenase
LRIFFGLHNDVIELFRGDYKEKPYIKISPSRVMEEIRRKGEHTIHQYNRLLYRVETERDGVYINRSEIDYAYSKLPSELIETIDNIISRLKNAERRKLSSLIHSSIPSVGVNISYTFKPYSRIGIGVSHKDPFKLISILVPPIAAGVKDILLVMPPIGNSGYDLLKLAILDRLGVKWIMRSYVPVGIMAMIVGTQSIPRIEKLYVLDRDTMSIRDTISRYTTYTQLYSNEKHVILADKSAEPEPLLWNIYAIIERSEDPAIAVISKDRNFIEDLITTHESLKNNVFVRRILDKIDEKTSLIIINDWNDAINIVSRLSPDNVHIILERDYQYRIIDYINNVRNIMVGNYTCINYYNCIGGVTDVYKEGGEPLSVIDFISLIRLTRVEREAISNDFESLTQLYEYLQLPAHYFSLKTRYE